MRAGGADDAALARLAELEFAIGGTRAAGKELL